MIRFVLIISCIAVGEAIRRIERRKRQKQKDIPENMNLLFEDSSTPSGQNRILYFICAIPFVMAIFVFGLIVMGSYTYGDSFLEIVEEGGIYFWLVVIILAVSQAFCLLMLKIKGRQKILWNQEGIWIDRAFSKRKAVRYEDIQKVVCYQQAEWNKNQGIAAFDWEGRRIFYVTAATTGYKSFCNTLYQKRPSAFEEKPGSNSWKIVL